MSTSGLNEDFSPLKVYGALFLGLTSFSLAPILVKYATDYSPYLVASIRTVIAFFILLPVYLSFRKKSSKDKQAVSSKEHLLVAVAGISLGFHFIAWISSIYYTSVASASVLVCMHPIILIVAEKITLKTTFRPLVWIGVFISFIGTLLLGYFDFNSESNFPNPALGNGLAILAAFIFAVYFLIGRKVRQRRSWIEYVFPVYSYAALTCFSFMLITDGFQIELDKTILIVGLALAIGPQIFGHGSLNYAVKYISATLLSTLILAEPILASILAYILFEELPLTESMIAMLVILMGIAVTWKRRAAKSIE